MVEMGQWAQLATMASFGGVFRIAPPITATEEQLNLALAIIEEALKIPGAMPLYEQKETSQQHANLVEARLQWKHLLNT